MAYKSLTGFDASNQNVINVADPSANTHAANKQYVDGVARGLRWKEAVRAASTANATLASAFENGDTLDGVVLATNDRILLKDQTTQTENGIYIVNASGAPTRAADLATSSDAKSIAVTVTNGTVNNDRVYIQTEDPAVVGTNNLLFSQLGGAGTSYTAGAGLTESPAGTFNVVNTNGDITVSANSIDLAAGVAGGGLTLTAGVLDVVAGTGITVNANDVALAATAAGAGLTHTAGVLDVVGDASITVGANSLGLATGVAGAGLTLTTGVLAVTNADGSIAVGTDTVSIGSGAAGAGLTLTAGVLDVVGDASITVGANSLGLATGVAGAGLTLTSGVLDIVGGGTSGITVSANSIAVDSSVARKYSTTIGNGALTSIAVTHNLGTRAIVWQLYDSTSFADVVCDAVRTDANTLTLTFAVAPTTNQYTVAVIG